MANVFDVAKYILSKINPVSTWKLQKLCYYAQAWHYTWTEKSLFSNRIEAWVNGPAIPDLYKELEGKFTISDINKGDANNLTNDEVDSVNVVLTNYGNEDPYQLREMTHHEEPWIEARKGYAENQPCSEEITLDSMGAYYGSL